MPLSKEAQQAISRGRRPTRDRDRPTSGKTAVQRWREQQAQRDGGGGFSLGSIAGEALGMVKATPSGLWHLGGEALETGGNFARNPTRFVYRSGQAIAKGDAEELREDFPLAATMAESGGATLGRVRHPSRYVRAAEEGHILGAVLEDVGNVALVGGIAAKGIGAGAKVASRVEAPTVAARQAGARTAARAAQQAAADARLTVAGSAERAAGMSRAQNAAAAARQARSGVTEASARSVRLGELGERVGRYSRLGERVAGGPAEVYAAPLRAAGRYASPAWRGFLATKPGQRVDAVLNERVREPWARHRERAEFAREDYERRQRPTTERGGEVVSAATRALRAVDGNEDLAVAANVLSAQAHKPLIAWLDRHLDDTARTLGEDPVVLKEQLVGEYLGPSVSPQAWRVIEDYERGAPTGETLPARPDGTEGLDPKVRARVDEARRILDEEVYEPAAARYEAGWGSRDPLTEEALEYRAANEGDQPNPVVVRRAKAEAAERVEAQRGVVAERQAEADRLAGRRVMSREEYRQGAETQVATTLRQARVAASAAVKRDRAQAARAAGFRGGRVTDVDLSDLSEARRVTDARGFSGTQNDYRMLHQLAGGDDHNLRAWIRENYGGDVGQLVERTAEGLRPTRNLIDNYDRLTETLRSAERRGVEFGEYLPADYLEVLGRIRAKRSGGKSPTDTQIVDRLASRIVRVGRGGTKNQALADVLAASDVLPNRYVVPGSEVYAPIERTAVDEATLAEARQRVGAYQSQAAQAGAQEAGLAARRPVASPAHTERLERAVTRLHDAARKAAEAGRARGRAEERVVGSAAKTIKRETVELRRAVLDSLRRHAYDIEGQLEQMMMRLGSVRVPRTEEYADLRNAAGGSGFRVAGKRFFATQTGRGTSLEDYIDLWGDLRNIRDPKTALDDLTSTIRAYREAKAAAQGGGVKLGLDVHPRQVEELLGYELDPLSREMLFGDIDDAVRRANRVIEGDPSLGGFVDYDALERMYADAAAAIRRGDPEGLSGEARAMYDENAAVVAREAAEVGVARARERAAARLVEMGRQHGQREGVLAGRKQVFEGEARYATQRGEAAASRLEGVDPYEQRVDVTSRIAGGAAEVGKKAGEREFAARQAERAVEQAQIRLARLVEKAERAGPEAAQSTAALPSKYAEALRASGNLRDGLTERAKVILSEAADEGDTGKAVAAAYLAELADDLPSNLDDLQFAGVDQPVYRPGVAPDVQPRGTGGSRDPRLPYSKLTREQKFKTRERGFTDWALRPQIVKVVESVTDGYRNEFARWIETSAPWTRKGSEWGSLSGRRLAEAARADGYVAWNPRTPISRVQDSAVRADTAFIPENIYDRFKRVFDGPGAVEKNIQKWYDRRFLGTLKVGWLALSPKWLGGNVIGNAFMGMSEVGIGDYLTSLPEAIKLYRSESPELPRTLFNRGFTHEEIGFLAGNQPMGGGRLRRGARAVVGKSFAMNEYVDNVSRSAIYLAKRKRGLSPEQAVKRALHAAGDFQRMSFVEREAIKRVWVFYPWYRHITKLSLSLPVEHPMRVAWTLHMADVWGNPDEQRQLPGFLQGSIPLGNDRYLRTGGLMPFTQAEDLPGFSPGAAVRSITPAISWPAAIFFGFDTGQMRYLSRPPGTASLDQYGREGPTALWKNPAEMAYWLTQQFPQGRTAVAAGVPPYQDRVARYRTGQQIIAQGRPIPLEYGPEGAGLGFAGIPYPERVDVESLRRRREQAERDAERSRRRYEAYRR